MMINDLVGFDTKEVASFYKSKVESVPCIVVTMKQGNEFVLTMGTEEIRDKTFTMISKRVLGLAYMTDDEFKQYYERLNS